MSGGSAGIRLSARTRRREACEGMRGHPKKQGSRVRAASSVTRSACRVAAVLVPAFLALAAEVHEQLGLRIRQPPGGLAAIRSQKFSRRYPGSVRSSTPLFIVPKVVRGLRLKPSVKAWTIPRLKSIHGYAPSTASRSPAGISSSPSPRTSASTPPVTSAISGRLCHGISGVHHDRRHRLPGRPPPGPQDRARFHADDAEGDAGAPPPLRPTAAADGHLELYQSTKSYEGAVGRKRHGYPPADQLPL